MKKRLLSVFLTLCMPAYPVTVTVIFKRVSAAPGAPVIGTGANHPTDTAITVSTYAGQEYYISTSADAPASWSGTGYFKAVEAGTHTFTGLTPATKYYIHTRTAETETDMITKIGTKVRRALFGPLGAFPPGIRLLFGPLCSIASARAFPIVGQKVGQKSASR